MELIWQSPESSARDIFEGLRDQGQRISYGAVKTVLDRLVAKDVLARLMVGNQYVYRATLNREDFTTAAIREILDSLVSSFGAPVYAQFVEQVRSTDPNQLEQLNQLINDAEQRLHDDAS
jgi:predicted transcriptional regulator